MINIFNIVKSRFINGQSLPKWYEERLNICSTCPLNSKNIDDKKKGIARKGWELIAGAHCTDPSCGCTITEKAKIEEEFCPKSKWLAVRGADFSDLDIVTDTSKVSLTFDDANKKYVADYGEIPYQFDSSFTVTIKDKDITSLIVRTTCGCTTASPRYTVRGVDLTIKYDTLRVGNFDKTVRLNYNKEGKPFQTIINIKGHVKKAK